MRRHSEHQGGPRLPYTATAGACAAQWRNQIDPLMFLDTTSAEVGDDNPVQEKPQTPRSRWIEIERARRAYYSGWSARMRAALAVSPVYGSPQH